MAMTCKDVEAKIYGYERFAGDTGKNLVADMLNELADAIGFDINLLKEDANPNKAFQFMEEDFEEIKWLMDAGKSKSGKRLRCRDYEGAGGFFVDEVANSLIRLAEHNNVSALDVIKQILKIYTSTRSIAIREYIREISTEFEDDIETKYFITADKAEDGFADYDMDEIAQQVFLEFVADNLDEDISYIRGVYWYFVVKKT